MAKDKPETLRHEQSPIEEPEREPRWPAFIAILAAVGVYTGLPEELTIGPRWLFPAAVLALSIPGIIFYHTGRHRLNSIFGLTAEGVLTARLGIFGSPPIPSPSTNNV